MNRAKFGGIVLTIIGYAALAWVAYSVVTNTVFWITAESTKGKIVGWDYMKTLSSQRGRLETSRAKAIIVSFQTKAGDEVVFTTDWGSGLVTYDSGEKVTMLYDPDDPENAKLRSFVSLYLGPLMLLIFSGAFLFFGSLIRAFAGEPAGREKNKYRSERQQSAGL